MPWFLLCAHHGSTQHICSHRAALSFSCFLAGRACRAHRRLLRGRHEGSLLRGHPPRRTTVRAIGAAAAAAAAVVVFPLPLPPLVAQGVFERAIRLCAVASLVVDRTTTVPVAYFRRRSCCAEQRWDMPSYPIVLSAFRPFGFLLLLLLVRVQNLKNLVLPLSSSMSKPSHSPVHALLSLIRTTTFCVRDYSESVADAIRRSMRQKRSYCSTRSQSRCVHAVATHGTRERYQLWRGM